MITVYDYAVIAFYFVFLGGLGWYYRHTAADSDEFFRGSGQMPWWLVGTKSFMGSFSAWTFTGAAALAYDHGFVVLVLYLANVLMFVSNWAWTAARFRQLRVIIGMEAIRLRLGLANEQFFIWISYPVGWLVAGIQLYGLGIICGSMFHLDVRTMIVVCGLSMIFLSALGGAWGVAASNFLQTLILLPITLVVAAYALHVSGGLGNLLHQLPPSSRDFLASDVKGFGAWFVVANVLDKLFNANSLTNTGAVYLAVRDGRAARKVALLSAALFLLGSAVWFLPPWTARALGWDLHALFPALARPSEGAFLAVVVKFFPAGLIGLFATGMISATLATMDNSLSGSAGIVARSIYLPLFRPKASERELVLVGRLATIVLGLVTIAIALVYTTWRDVGVFQLMLSFGAILGIPMAIPIVCCLFLRRAPDWAAWSTVVVNLGAVGLGTFLATLPSFQAMVARAGLSAYLQRFVEHDYVFLVLFNLVTGVGWYVLVAILFRDRLSAPRRAHVKEFFRRFDTPLSPAELREEGSDSIRTVGIGKLVMGFAGVIALLIFIPNPLPGRLAILFCVAAVGLIGFGLYRFGGRVTPAAVKKN
ncbi:MAG: sglT 4 [Verrucomicrobia bacterium]|nr:sglT 4 [Verrucomicrobiota bacterium]